MNDDNHNLLVIMVSFVMPNVVMLSVVMLRVVAPNEGCIKEGAMTLSIMTFSVMILSIILWNLTLGISDTYINSGRHYSECRECQNANKINFHVEIFPLSYRKETKFVTSATK